MKLARILMTVLLAVLLPIQGAVAAAMLCPHESAVSHDHGLSEPHESTMDHGQMLGIDGADEPHHHSADRHAGKCGLCAACCSGAALVAGGPSDLRFVPTAAVTFPVARFPAASFLSDGQERPPRSF